MYRFIALVLVAAGAIQAETRWLDTVAPIITPAEKKTYLSLAASERQAFQEKFWAARSIGAEEYERRISYIDSKFGSSRRGSGANTDPGRVYLSLGAPTQVTRLPSSRVFVPLEIWYYDSVPGYLNTELRLIFYYPRSVGLPKLYSPTLDTIRELLLPDANSVHMFGPNDSVTESDIRRNLMVGPVEEEVITAASGVASGIKYSGNDEILGQVTSPEFMLSKARATQVTSRLITSQPELDVLETESFHGARQIDLRMFTSAQREIGLEVLHGFVTVYNNRLNLKFPKVQELEYTHRLDLLPGNYRLMFTVDAKTFAYSLNIPEKPEMGKIKRADAGSDVTKRHTPFEFDGKQFELNPSGNIAIVSVPAPGKVTWVIREGTRVTWRSTVDAETLAMIDLPSLPPGSYKLEAVCGEGSQNADLTISKAAPATSRAALVSFNANLAPARRLTLVANQWLTRGRFDTAREILAEALTKTGPAKAETKDVQIALARVDAVSGNLDAARDRVRKILAALPNDFESLSLFAYIETRFQDYPIAAELYRRALAVQDSPALRLALAKLPSQ